MSANLIAVTTRDEKEYECMSGDAHVFADEAAKNDYVI